MGACYGGTRGLMAVSLEGLRGNWKRLGKILFTLALAIAVLIHWDPGAMFYVGLLAASVTGLIDGRVSVAAGLLCIVCCPLLLIVDQEAWLQQSSLVNYYAANTGLYDLSNAADTMAIWAFYFLSIGVVALTVQYVVRERRSATRTAKVSTASVPDVRAVLDYDSNAF